MDKITINGKRYIGLGDFDHLRRNLVADIYDRYEKDENGQYPLSPEDKGALRAYAAILGEVMQDELRQAAPDDMPEDERRKQRKKVYDSLKDEWMRDSYVIAGKDGEETIYFRMMCPYAPKPEDTDEDTFTDTAEETPVFTGMRRLARWWSDHYKAVCFCEYLKTRTKIESLKVVPAWIEFMSDAARKRLLDAIFGDGEEDRPERWCVFLEPEGDDPKMWLSDWLTYHEEMPAAVRELCKKSGMRPGETKPMFVDTTGGDAMTFESRDAAMAEAAKVIESEPEMKGRLHVMVYEEAPAASEV